MEGKRIGLLVSRALQIIFAAIVLGISVQLAIDINNYFKLCKEGAKKSERKYCSDNRVQSAIEYASFTGAFGLLDALVTLVAVFVSAIPWVIVVGFDVLAAIFYLAGGINSAVLDDGQTTCGVDGWHLNDLCARWNTSAAFMFLGFFASVAAAVLVFLSRGSGSMTTRHSAV